jgi:P pilus assembly chaperone PapD
MYLRFSKTFALVTALAVAASANADVSLNSVRVVAKDAEALGKFVTDPEGNAIELIQPARR